MDTNVQTIVDTILGKAIEAATSTGDFLKEQIPDVVNQLIKWTIVSNTVGVLFGSLALVGSYKMAKAAMASCRGYREFWAFGVVASIIPGLAMTISSGMELIKILVAPKLWLLEYAAHLMRH